MRIQQIREIWNSNSSHLAAYHSESQIKDFQFKLANFFCPGPFYYYVLDFSNYQFNTVSESYRHIIGLDPDLITIDDLLSRIHPDDVSHFARCEEIIASFLFQYLKPPQILDYKISYSFRNLTAEGVYKLFLHQVSTLTLDEAGRLGTVLGVHSDISHITNINNMKLSLLGSNGNPSYFNIDVNSFDGFNPIPIPNQLTKREIEIIRLISDGVSTKEISHLLFIAIPTVKKHRENILRKTESKNTAQLVRNCIRLGLI